jgi:hypothetical protein
MTTFSEVLTILVLCFLFVGEPDLWDVLLDRAIKSAQCTKEDA